MKCYTFGGSSTDKNGTATKSTTTPKESVEVNGTANAPAETQAVPATTDDGKLRIYPGEILNDGDFQIEFVSAEDFTGYDDWATPADGNKIIKLNLKCQNNGTSDKIISYFDFDCYADNETADAYYHGDDNLSATVSPGRAASGAVYFEVPADAASIEVEYEINVWTDEKAIFVVK